MATHLSGVNGNEANSVRRQQRSVAPPDGVFFGAFLLFSSHASIVSGAIIERARSRAFGSSPCWSARCCGSSAPPGVGIR